MPYSVSFGRALVIVSIFTSLVLFMWNFNLSEFGVIEHIHRNSNNTGNKVREVAPLAFELKEKVKLLCWIMTSPKTIETKARAINRTWAQHCDISLYVSSKPNANPPATVVNVKEGRNQLTYKTREAMKYIYKHHFHDVDWFLKTDDDTFVIIDNLRYLLAHFDPRVPVSLGHQLYSAKHKVNFTQGESWQSGGAGYVLSRGALSKLVQKGIPDWKLCPFKEAEDYYIGFCLEKLGVRQGHSADRNDLPTFLPLNIKDMINEDDKAPADLPKRVPEWYYRYSVHTGDKGQRYGCCSPYPISFHYIQPPDMYLFYFFIYKVRVFGRPESSPDLEDSVFKDLRHRPPVKSILNLPNPEKWR